MKYVRDSAEGLMVGCDFVVRTTPELCERMLLFLRHPKSILQAAQIFKDVENTIQGSSKLQIALFYRSDLRTVTGTAVKRKRRRNSYYMKQKYRNMIPVTTPLPPERLVAINSLVFTTPCSCDDNQLLYLCLHIKKLYNAARPNLGSLAKLFLTQPPVETVDVERFMFGWDQRISWQLELPAVSKSKTWLTLFGRSRRIRHSSEGRSRGRTRNVLCA
ncbi:hypothetical protein TI39_contig4111g00016 [Zymoseptoria brevis]|uniref:Uncharacterized protein n=1 Tax=Zymoseptoria brevis TaxID=1047168 RepID=A0A0F4GDK6_9PEZI|nr:hypothetical protein TI39_contig4111g00016 [Zymoseptoria brevis]